VYEHAVITVTNSPLDFLIAKEGSENNQSVYENVYVKC
jgi:hypothetical protein